MRAFFDFAYLVPTTNCPGNCCTKIVTDHFNCIKYIFPDLGYFMEMFGFAYPYTNFNIKWVTFFAKIDIRVGNSKHFHDMYIRITKVKKNVLDAVKMARNNFWATII